MLAPRKGCAADCHRRPHWVGASAIGDTMNASFPALQSRWYASSAQRAAANRAGLRPLEWRQLEQLVDAGGAWISARATIPPGSALAAQEASVGLRALRARGLAEYSRGAGGR